MINTKKEYQKYADKLLDKGISPAIVSIAEVIKILTLDEEKFDYDFNTNNIVSGADGELIRIDRENGTVEIYNCFIEDFFSLKVYDLETGKIFEDGTLYMDIDRYDSIDLFGYDKYLYFGDCIIRDYSDCYREINRDKEEIDIHMLELYNKLSKSKLMNLKENLLKVAYRYCKKDTNMNKGVGKILSDIDTAYHMHSKPKQFHSDELDIEMVEIINRNLYLNSLKEESYAYSKISILPIIDVIEEYKAYKTSKTDKLVKKYIFISKKLNEVLSPFSDYRIELRNSLVNSKDINRMEQKHKKILINRKNEIDGIGNWGSYE